MENAVPQVLNKPYLVGVILNKQWLCLNTTHGPTMFQVPLGPVKVQVRVPVPEAA